jgi:MFS family permease
MAEPGFFEKRQSLAPLALRDFRLLIMGTLFVQLALPLQFITQIFWVQHHYEEREVLYVGLIAGSRGMAMLLFGLIGGAIADRYERRRVLFINQCLALTLNAAIAGLMLTRPMGEATIIPMLAVTFLVSCTFAIDLPTRQASMPSIVGMERLSSAISLNMTAMQLAIPFTLPLVGFLNSVFDPGPVYAGTLAVWALILPAVASLRFTSRGQANRAENVFQNVAGGIRYIRHDAIIFAVITVVLTMQVLAMPGVAQLGPVWMTSVLGLSEFQFGLIAMTWGFGAITASVFLTRRNDLTRRGITLCIAVMAFAGFVVIFGHSRFVPLTAVANFGLGVTMIATMVSASSISQHVTSEEMRGRVMGLFPLTMGLSMMAAAPIGFLGQALSLEFVVPAMGWLTLAVAALVILRAPRLRAANPEPLKAAAPVPVPGGGE